MRISANKNRFGNPDTQDTWTENSVQKDWDVVIGNNK